MDFANLPDNYILEYFTIAIFLLIVAFITIALVGVSYFLGPKNRYEGKLTYYECGLPAFDDSRNRFDVRFYLVGILFVIFDVELIFVYPWAVVFKDISLIGFYSMLLFIVILAISFIYEWKKGVLEWY